MKLAKGVKGFLIGTEDCIMFRVYDKSHPDGFIDYDILASDIEITITDNFVGLYDSENGINTLDYAPEVLGGTNV